MADNETKGPMPAPFNETNPHPKREMPNAGTMGGTLSPATPQGGGGRCHPPKVGTLK